MKRSWSKSLLEFKGCSSAFAKKHLQVVLVSRAGYGHMKATKMLSAGCLILANAEVVREEDSLSSAQASPCYLKCKCLPRIHTHAHLWAIRRREYKIWGLVRFLPGSRRNERRKDIYWQKAGMTKEGKGQMGAHCIRGTVLERQA